MLHLRGAAYSFIYLLGLKIKRKRSWSPIAGRSSTGVGAIPLDGAQTRANAALPWFNSNVCCSFGVRWWGYSPPHPPTPVGLLHCSDVLFAVTSGMSRW